MIKNLRFFLLSMVAMLAGTAMAEVTLDFDNDYQTLFPTITGVSQSKTADQEASSAGDITEAVISTAVDGITVTVSASTTSTPNRIWVSSPRLRLYGGTFTVTGKGITKIVFTGHNSNFNLTVTTGTLDGKTWTGEAADEVVFNVTKNTQISTVTIYQGDEPDEPEQPVVTEGQTPETAITAARALELIAELADGAKTPDNYYVKGTVESIQEVSTKYGNVTFVLAGGLTAFRLKGLENKNVTNENFIDVDDEVVVFGQLQKYANKDGETTPEVAQGGYVYSVNGNTKADEQEEPEPQPAEVETITVAKALEIGATLDAGKTTDKEYIVNGFVVAEPVWNPYTDKTTGEVKNYNLQFQMNDAAGATENALLVYNAWNQDNTYFPTIDENLVVGTEVSLQGKIQNYVKNDESTIEFVKAHFLQIGVVNSINTVKAGTEQGTVYNLAGQRVMNAQKGLFIMNGKKFVVK